MSDRSEQVKSIFLEAIEKHAPEQWPAFLEQACAGDAVLRAGVEKLLDAQAEIGSFHEEPRPPLVATVDEPLTERPGTVIGPYKLLEQIGEGGFGVVYMAEQQQPVRRTVALKVIKPGMDTRQVVARFEAEQQALALMDHPHIARVLDAGATDSGRPYFVMELVRGIPITQFGDENRLTPRQRLGLFIPVCQAVQHAHQKGIIHRDLKPSNVLVTLHDGVPVVKVIDFGIAKAMGQRLTDKTLVTGFAQMIGTPLYMSPEQAELSGLDVDTRSDIYSLGVLLYELLTGTTPFDTERLKEASYDEIRRIIREEEPPKPSTRISTLGQAAATVSASRQSDPKKLGQLIRGELDWIVMKCLEKDRNRRYETANGLALDLQRYLADEPVQACPPSAWYRFRKLVRRKKAWLATAALMLFFLVLLGGGVGWAVRDRAARQAKVAADFQAALEEAERSQKEGKWPQAQAAAKRAEALLKDGTAEPALAERVQGLLRELAEEEADRRLVARLEEIRLLQAEVNVKENRFLLERALPEYRQAFRDYGLPAGAMTPTEAAALLRRRPPAVRGTLLAALDDWLDLARRRKPSEADWLERVLSAADSDAWRQRLRAARGRRDRPALEQLAREVDVAARPPQALFLLDRALYARGAKEASLALLRRTQEAFPGDFWTNQNLGGALFDCQPPQLDEAIRFLTAAVALRPASPGARLNLGLALGSKGRLDEAIAAFRKAIDLKPDYAEGHYNLGRCLWKAGRLDEAITAFRKAIELKAAFAEAHADLGGALAARGRLDEAVAAGRRAVELKPDLWQAHYQLGNALLAKGRFDEAGAAFREAIKRKSDYPEAHCNLGVVLSRKGRLDDAIVSYRKAVELNPDLLRAHYNLARSLEIKGRLDEAVAAYHRVLELKPDYAEAHYDLGNALSNQDRLDEAVAAYRKAVELKPDYAEAHCNLGAVLRQQGEFAQALAAIQRGHELGARRPDWPYPSARWVKEYQLLGELQGRLPAVLRGEAQPANAAERSAYARLCYDKKLYAASARLRASVLTAEPKLADDLEGGYRFDAAWTATLAGCGQGTDADQTDDKERTRWRKQAVEWLRADLEAYGKWLEGGKPRDRQLVRHRLRSWQDHQALAGLRDPAAVAKLPGGEQEACEQLWAEVQALLSKADAAR